MRQHMLPVRLALRELRAGLSGFRIFLVCLVLGVAAIAAVGTFSAALQGGLAREGRSILGGDLEFALVHEDISAAQKSFLEARGEVSRVATMRAMARTPDGASRALVELKAVDGAYPLYGQLELESGGSPAEKLARTGEAYGALVEPTALARFGISVGDELRTGDITLRVTDVIRTEPDRIASGMSIGPRVMISHEALTASGLVLPGSLVRWRYRLALDNATAEDVTALNGAAKQAFPDAGWRIRDRANGAPGMRRFVERLTVFLTLVGLTSLLVGGVGVGNGVRSYLDTKRETIATYKSLGATGGLIFRIFLCQVMLLACLAIAAGIAIGAVLPMIIAMAVEDILPIPIAFGLFPEPLLLATAFGLLTTLAFSLWPLGRAREIPASALFRDIVAPTRVWPRPVYLVSIAVTLGLLAGLAVMLSDDRRITLFYVAGAAGAFVLLALIARLLMAGARRIGRLKRPEFRLGLANLHRPGAPTPSVVLSLGLGLTLLVALSLTDANMTRELGSQMSDRSPSFFFVDIQPDQLPEFEKIVADTPDVSSTNRVPMLRGRIIRLNGTPVDQIEPDPGARWVVRGARAVTYAETLPDNSTLMRGEWWPADYDGPPLVSFVDELARGLGLDLGDEITVNVLGREITARIANTRAVEWGSLQINTVMVFSPNTLRGAPHTHLATVTMDEAGELDLLRRVNDAFPNVTAVRIKDVLDTINDLMGKLLLAIRGASLVALFAGVLVLAGAMAAGHRARIYDAVVLKTVGATRRRLTVSYVFEFAVLGLATAVFAVFAGSVASWAVARFAMEINWTFMPGIAIWTVAGATVLTVVLGLAGTWRILGKRPAQVLRGRD